MAESFKSRFQQLMNFAQRLRDRKANRSMELLADGMSERMATSAADQDIEEAGLRESAQIEVSVAVDLAAALDAEFARQADERSQFEAAAAAVLDETEAALVKVFRINAQALPRLRYRSVHMMFSCFLSCCFGCEGGFCDQGTTR